MINQVIKADENRWSKSWEYALAAYYEDIKYVCIKCNSEAVFLAQDQKQAYEVRKEYMWIERKLCYICWKQMRAIKAELYRVEREYCENKPKALSNKEFLTQWLGMLELYPKFGKKSNLARIDFVKKHLANNGWWSYGNSEINRLYNWL